MASSTRRSQTSCP